MYYLLKYYASVYHTVSHGALNHMHLRCQSEQNTFDVDHFGSSGEIICTTFCVITLKP
jgi:hypothetical protein